MPVLTSAYWLAYICESPMEDGCEVTVTSTSVLDRDLIGKGARAVLVAADAYHGVYPEECVVFVASVTHWLARVHEYSWTASGVDLDAALADLRAQAASTTLAPSPAALAVVATGGEGLDVSLASHTRGVRSAIEQLLLHQRLS